MGLAVDGTRGPDIDGTMGLAMDGLRGLDVDCPSAIKGRGRMTFCFLFLDVKLGHVIIAISPTFRHVLYTNGLSGPHSPFLSGDCSISFLDVDWISP